MRLRFRKHILWTIIPTAVALILIHRLIKSIVYHVQFTWIEVPEAQIEVNRERVMISLPVPTFTLGFRQYALNDASISAEWQTSLQLTSHLLTDVPHSLQELIYRTKYDSYRRPFTIITMSEKVDNTKLSTIIYNWFASWHPLALPSYDSLVETAVDQLKSYADRHGYQFHIDHPKGIVQTTTISDLYWSKVVLLKHYMTMGLESRQNDAWLLWTDTDVLILHTALPLDVFVSTVPDSVHAVGVLECGRRNGRVRSGWFFLRISETSLALIDAWLSLRPTFSNSKIPEQNALELLVTTENWRHVWRYVPSHVMHEYIECYRGDTFSVHFPNNDRKLCLDQWVQGMGKIR